MKSVLLCTPKGTHPEYWQLFYQAFVAHGFDVTFFNDETDSLIWSPDWNTKQFDLFFSTVWPDMVSIPFGKLSRLARKTAVWVTGGGHSGLSYDYQRYLSQFDYIFSNSKCWFAKSSIKKYGAKFHIAHLGYRKLIPPLQKSAQRKYGLSFVGTIYPPRLKFLEQFCGLGLKVWAPRWDRQIANFYPNIDFDYQGEAAQSKMLQIFDNSWLTVNPIFKDALNMRLFEAGCRGNVQVCPRTDELDKYFEDGKDIIMFSNKSELHEKVRYYLAHTDKITEIESNLINSFGNKHSLLSIIERILRIVQTC